MISSYIGGNKDFERMYLNGEVSLELVPQGTLVERIRAHAAGIPCFLTPTGASTAVEHGSIPIRYNPGGFKNGVMIPGNKKEGRIINGRRYIMEPALVGDVAFIHAWKVDEVGNTVFRYTANNFSTVMAKNAALTIVEAEEIVPRGALDPNYIHLPGVYVDRIVMATAPKQIEIMKLASDASAPPSPLDGGKDDARRHRICRRAAKELRNGDHVNLGIGMPTLVPEYLPKGVSVWLQSENGILGLWLCILLYNCFLIWQLEQVWDHTQQRTKWMRKLPKRYCQHYVPDIPFSDIVNAGKETVTLLAGSSVFGTWL